MKKSFFKAAGKRGGQKRAKNLSPGRRSEIAARAARSRWKGPKAGSALMQSVRFDQPKLSDPAYVEEMLLDGSLQDWRCLYEEVSDRPFGPAAAALKTVLSSTKHYGVTPLWSGLLRNIQGAS